MNLEERGEFKEEIIKRIIYIIVAEYSTRKGLFFSLFFFFFPSFFSVLFSLMEVKSDFLGSALISTSNPPTNAHYFSPFLAPACSQIAIARDQKSKHPPKQ